MGIVYNAIKTPDGTILESWGAHDFKSHIDKNGRYYAVDGGLDYLRRVADEFDFEDLSLSEEDRIEVIREKTSWGSYGKSGKEKFRRILLKDMESEHIEAVLSLPYVNQAVKRAMERELELRKSMKM